MTGQVDPRAPRAQHDWEPEATYRALLRHALLRLVFLYFIPLLLLTVFFHVQYQLVARDADERHLQALAEHQAAMLDVFLGDRLLNLTGLTDDPDILLAPHPSELEIFLSQLTAASAAFVDLAVLDGEGRVLAYAGPLPELADRNYRQETWFARLLVGESLHVITDTYPGFRGEPHYTMALKLEPRGTVRILRAVISPVITAAHLAALDAGRQEPDKDGILADIASNIWLVTVVFCALGGVLISLQARWVARQQFAALKTEQELTRQLVHAARLATVGEITAGIAHEVNNPLAVVAEKTGLVKDLLDPQFGHPPEPEILRAHLQDIETAAFRATSITQRLLGFVRPDAVKLARCTLPELIDEVVDVMLRAILAEAGANVQRDYDAGLGPIITDPDRLQQVLLNLLKNAADAVAGGGAIDIRTRRRGTRFVIEVSDTGPGLSAKEMDRVFMPFFTTKAPGEGTGLGLSISYGIVVGLGGRLSVSSRPGEGCTFVVELPLGGDDDQRE